jgi:hypothetical protein
LKERESKGILQNSLGKVDGALQLKCLHPNMTFIQKLKIKKEYYCSKDVSWAD